ncbi:MAG: hypothetical protein CMM59_08910 [Rhodospirillaceae bacterium]|nr:hypothetical protein [Rhodospirillaceae bacterium]|tara:strand:+ start:1109 stop:2404 length:1296 start_codon:yes stop_codon:yes gene_type:complete
MTDRTILLVDNEPGEVERLTQQLSPFGYTVEQCTSTSAIAERISQNNPAVLLVRVDRAPNDGEPAAIEEVSRLFKSGDNVPPTIFLADDYDLKTRLESIRVGAKAFFVRPFSPLDLVDALDLLIEPQEEEPFRVLIVDDDERISEFYVTVLQHAGMEAMALSDPMKVLDALSDFRPELVLMDQYMPEIEGRELGAVIRQEAAFLSIPIVFLSAESDPDKQLELMQIGADEFLTKPISPERLVTAISIRAERFRRLRSMMLRDSLTGLLNPTTTKEQLSIELSRMRRGNMSLAFALIDLDHFKSVNDTYGHPIGDQVLKTMSNMLKQRLRMTDLIGRYGGEEFAVALPDVSPSNAVLVLDKVREAFSQIKQIHAGGEFNVTMSCGVAMFPDFEDVPSLTEAADQALYEAKAKGRNQVVLAAPQTAGKRTAEG